MAARRRSKETVRTELERTRTRLDLYLAREQEMLSKDGVQLYTIGSRNLQRYQTPLTAIQDEIEKLRKRISELEAELAGQSARRAVGVVPRDW
jgi:hypothetical protein